MLAVDRLSQNWLKHLPRWLVILVDILLFRCVWRRIKSLLIQLQHVIKLLLFYFSKKRLKTAMLVDE
jgi:hypothetical protein